MKPDSPTKYTGPERRKLRRPPTLETLVDLHYDLQRQVDHHDLNTDRRLGTLETSVATFTRAQSENYAAVMRAILHVDHRLGELCASLDKTRAQPPGNV